MEAKGKTVMEKKEDIAKKKKRGKGGTEGRRERTLPETSGRTFSVYLCLRFTHLVTEYIID